MADARSLLRQQRITRRVQHPHAFYSDAGKLLCTVCREQIRAESQWDDHIKSRAHQQRLQSQTTSQEQTTTRGGIPESSSATGKRKLLQDEGDDSVAAPGADGAVEEKEDLSEEASRRKRSRAGLLSEQESTTAQPSNGSVQQQSGSFKDTPGELSKRDTPPKSTTPPSLTRRASATPSQGVEIQIPSRPATPSHRREGSTASTPLTANGFPTNGSGPSSGDKAQQQAGSRAAGSALAAAVSFRFPVVSTPTTSRAAAGGQQGATVDEDEWAAFEADIAAVPDGSFDASAAEGATISAAPMTASESLAAKKAAEQEQGEPLSVEESADRLRQLEKERVQAEKEEADRALEMEFEEMEELESRVKKLKERREMLRRTQSQGQGDRPDMMETDGKGGEKENAVVEGKDDQGSSDDDEDEDDDWDEFRFRGR